jgi:hypothetical protein
MTRYIYYFPTLHTICDDLYTLKYCVIENNYYRERAINQDTNTKLLKLNMYWKFLCHSDSTPEHFKDYITNIIHNPSYTDLNIRAAYDATTQTQYGICTQEQNIILRIKPIDVHKSESMLFVDSA